MFLGEAFESVSKNLESDPTIYEEAMADSDSSYWVKAMEIEMESMHSNQVWELVEPPPILNLLAVSGSIRGKEDRMGRWKLQDKAGG